MNAQGFQREKAERAGSVMTRGDQSQTLQSRAASGLRWTIVNVIGEKVLSFGTTMVLARLLDPRHFGLYALAFVVIDSFGIFKNLGLDAAIVQRRDRVEEAADTAVIVLPFIGMLLCALLYLIAPAAATWMGNPEAGKPIQALGLSLVIMSAGNVPAALIQRQMRFRLRTVANLIGMVVYALVAVVLAMYGFEIWSLVIAYLLRWVLTTLLQWIALGWVPRWRFDVSLFKEMLHYSKYIVGAWLVGFLASNADKVIIGRWLGATQLGYYTLCFGLANIVTSQLSTRVYLVAFPAFAEAQDTPELLRRGFLKLMKYLVMCSLPVSTLLIMAPADLLGIFYGGRWIVAAPVLQILAIAGVLQVIRSGIEPVLLGCGRSREVFTLNLLQLILLVLGGVPAAQTGRATAVAWASALAAGVPSLIGVRLVMKQIGIRFSELVQQLRPTALSVLLMVIAVSIGGIGHRTLGDSSILAWASAVMLIATGGLAYILGLLRWDRPVTQEMLRLVWPRIPTIVKGS